MGDPGIRASDADRERTVAVLQQEVGTGRLTLDEFAERSSAAYRARLLGELAALTRDLPRAAPTGTPRAPHEPVPTLVAIALMLLMSLTLLALAGPAAAGAMGELMDQARSGCH
jgi:hypothetical protein